MYCSEDDEKSLTSRELDVLTCIQKGLSNSEIAKKLCVTVSTVKAHISSLLQKFHAKNRIELLLMLLGEKDINNKFIEKQILKIK